MKPEIRKALLDLLPKREVDILEMRFTEKQTRKVIAFAFGLSESRIQQLERRSRYKLKYAVRRGKITEEVVQQFIKDL